MICSLAAAVKLDNDDKGPDRGAAFVAVWSMLLVICFAIGGTLVLRKYRSNMSFGFFLGTSAMMSQMMFMNFAIFAGLVDEEEGATSANMAMSAFSFFLWVILTIFTAVLVYDRSHILDQPSAPPAPKVDLEPKAAESSDVVNAGGDCSICFMNIAEG